MKIFFTCIGRRVELIQTFRNAADTLAIPLVIYGSDVSASAPALRFCDHRMLVPPINAKDYIPQLVSVCAREQIDALIPTIDTDLLILAQSKGEFAQVGTRVIVCDEDRIQLCRDKRRTHEFFVECGLLSPMPQDDASQYSAGFPCFIKPLNGSSSINAFKVNNQQELALYAQKIFDYIVQPYIEGTEFTVDIFCDFDGKPIYITPRERISVRGGEVQRTRIVQDEGIINECKGLIERFKPCGAITIQLIKKKNTDANYYIEINSRFGGGAPLSIKAGADSAESILRLLGGEGLHFQPRAAREGAIYSRYDQSVCTSTGSSHNVRAIIFDLDDTLYPEREYVSSGFKCVADSLPGIPDAYEKLIRAFETKRPALDAVLCDKGCCTEEQKRHYLGLYRQHKPNIHLYEGISELLLTLRQRGIKLGIITDGRPEGQRNKIEALNLAEMVDEIVITDELGGEQFRKPCDIAFRIMQRRLRVPFHQMLYVGDNPQKDFQAPGSLGMKTMYFRNPDGLYIDHAQEGGDTADYTAYSVKQFVENALIFAGGGGMSIV